MFKQIIVQGSLFLLAMYAFLFGYQYVKYPGVEEKDKIKKLSSMEPKKTPQEIQNNPFARFPDSKVKTKLFTEGKLVYEAEYENDAFLCRKTVTTNPTAVKHAVFSGCSFVYGDGLAANETIPYYFQKTTTEYEDRNIGFPGGGIHTLLKHMETYPWKDMLKQKEGVHFYFYIKDHLNRFHANHRYLSWAHPASPVYKIINQTVVSAGEARDQDPFKIGQMAKKVMLNKLYVNFYNKEHFDEDSIKDFVIAIDEARKRYKADFPNGEFIFVFHPLAESGETKHVLFESLKEKNIKYLDAEEDFASMLKVNGMSLASFRIPLDHHPNAKLNQWLGAYLLEKITPKPVPVELPVLDQAGNPVPNVAPPAATPDVNPAPVTQTPVPTQNPTPVPVQ